MNVLICGLIQAFAQSTNQQVNQSTNPQVTSLQLVLERTGAVIAADVEIAANPWRRARGLLGRSSIPPGRGMLLRPCRSIHTWFMRFPIDAVFLDAHDTVVRIAPKLPAFRVAAGGRKAVAVVELPEGTTEANQLQVGDRLTLTGTGH